MNLPHSLCRTPGPKLKDWHTVGRLNTKPPRFSFPPYWCLGPIVNNSAKGIEECQTPAGLAAISYEINPLVIKRALNLTPLRIYLALKREFSSGSCLVVSSNNWSLNSFQCNVPTCGRLAKDTKVLDIYVTNRDRVLMEVSRVEKGAEKGIKLDIPRTNASMENFPVTIRAFY